MHIAFDFRHYLSDVDSSVTLCEFPELVSGFRQRFLVNPDKDTVFALAKRESQELEFLVRVDLGNVALFPVDLQLQLSFQVPDTAFQQSSCRSLTLAEQYDVVSVPDDRYSPFLVFVVEFIQVYVCQ